MSSLPFPLSNVLVPEHYLLNEREAQKVLEEYNIDKYQLPKIYTTDPAIRHLPVHEGDIIKIIRKSPTAKVALAYRVVISRDKNIIPSTFQDTSFIKLFNSDIRHDIVSEEQICNELRKDLLSLVAPHRGFDRIIVSREKEVKWLDETVLSNENNSLTLIEGEIGSGKTFLMNLLKERGLQKDFVMSKIEISKVRSLSDVDNLYFQIINNFTLPEQPLVMGKLELIFKKLLFNIYTLSCKELSDLGFQTSDTLRVKALMINKANQFISKIDQLYNIIAIDVANFFDAAIMNSDLYPDFKLHERTKMSREIKSIYAFAQLIQYAGYRGLIILIDEMEQDRTLNSYNVIYDLQKSSPINGIKIVIAGTSDLMEEKSSGVRSLKKELYDLLEKSKISITPLTSGHKKELAMKIVKVLRVAKTIQNVDESLINSKIDEFLRSKEMSSISTIRDFVKNFIKYIEKELG